MLTYLRDPGLHTVVVRKQMLSAGGELDALLWSLILDADLSLLLECLFLTSCAVAPKGVTRRLNFKWITR